GVQVARRERQTLPDAVAQLGGGGFSERDRHEAVHRQLALSNKCNNARHQLARFTGARAGFDEKRRIEVRDQARADVSVNGRHASPSALLEEASSSNAMKLPQPSCCLRSQS